MTQTSISRHIAREVLISALINSAISLAFVFLVFSGLRKVPVWGVPGLMSDCVPQGFMIGLMTALLPSLLARRPLTTGRLRIGHALQSPLAHLVFIALLSAIAAAVLLTGATAAALTIGSWQSVNFSNALALKGLAGAVLGAAVTKITLSRMLRTS